MCVCVCVCVKIYIAEDNISFLFFFYNLNCVSGRELWVMALGTSPSQHQTLRPEVKYVGNIHGNEVSSTNEIFYMKT